SFGIATSTVPTRVSSSRARYPLRRFTRSWLRTPYSAPHTLSACADSSAFTNVVNSSRSRSGLASASSSFKNRAGSILGPTVIVMLHSRVLWKVHSKDHPVAVTYINNDTATDCSYTTLLDSTPPRRARCVVAFEDSLGS